MNFAIQDLESKSTDHADITLDPTHNTQRVQKGYIRQIKDINDARIYATQKITQLKPLLKHLKSTEISK